MTVQPISTSVPGSASIQGIVGHFEVDCASGTGIGAVRTAITDAAAGLKMMGEQWPRTWVRATSDLCDAGGPPYISATRACGTS